MVYQGFFFLQFKVFKKITYYFLYIIHYLNLIISFFPLFLLFCMELVKELNV